MDKEHVFISYCHDNFEEVKRLRQELLAADEKVWWDEEVLGGESWKRAVRRAMKRCYAVVLCLSKEVEARDSSGVYPELLDAIEVYRQLRPGSVFIIPVRLSECQIPDVEINATQTLDELEYVDLFPDSYRDEGLRRLLASIRSAPLRP